MASQTPSAPDVMKNVEQAYSALKSYSDSATISVGSYSSSRRVMRSTTQYLRPGRVIARMTGPYGSQSAEYALWSRGDKIWTWRRFFPGADENRAAYHVTRAVFGFQQAEYEILDTASKFSDFRVLTQAGMPLPFLIVQDEWALPYAWGRSKAEFTVSSVSFDGRTCWRLRHATAARQPERIVEIDVDAESFLVRRYCSTEWEKTEVTFRPVANPPIELDALDFDVPRLTFPAVAPAPPPPSSHAAFPPQADPPRAPEPVQRILDRCARAYEACESYSDTGKLTEISWPPPMMHAQNPTIHAEAFQTRFVRGKGLLIDLSPAPADPGVTGIQQQPSYDFRRVSWWVGGWNRSWSMTRYPSNGGSKAIEVHGHEAPGSIRFDVEVATHLNGSRYGSQPNVLAFGPDSRLQADEIVDGRPCFVIGFQRESKESEPNFGGRSITTSATVWIDKTSYLVRRYQAAGSRYRASVQIDSSINAPIPRSQLVFEPPLVKLSP